MMIHLDDIKAFIHVDRDKKFDAFLPVITTLISGLAIILSISPEYLRELNPLTLFMVSVTCALPVWAFNQLLWWHLGRKISSELVGKTASIFEVSEKGKKVLSLALSQLMKAIDVMRFIPSKEIANLITIITIYLGAVANYLTYNSPVFLYGTIFSLSFFAWITGLFFLHRASQKIDVKPFKSVWEQLRHNEELIEHINQHVERIEHLIRSSTRLLHCKNDTAESTDREDSSGQQTEQ